MTHTLGIELGSTRVKAVLIDEHFSPVASGAYDWENRLENGYWTYSLDDVWDGLRDAYARLMDDARQKGVTPDIGAIGISAMMHGYLVFDKDGNLLTPFRTWRNTTTGRAAETLTRHFGFNIPQRWSVAHLYQAILDAETHVRDIALLTTLSGYIHLKLTGQKVIGVGDASGMFPIDSDTGCFDSRMLNLFDALTGNALKDIRAVLPRVLSAGENAGYLTEEGARLLDPSGGLRVGLPLCPPEGDAGTGMVATNSVAECTGNVSAGTSIFAMIVLEKRLAGVYPEIDVVTTPAGKPVAMVHANNCTSEIDAWARLFDDLLSSAGLALDKTALYTLLFQSASQGDPDCGGLLGYNFLAGETIVKLAEGRPLTVRWPDSRFTLANFMRCQIFSAMALMKMGMDLLTEQENIKVERLIGHGGLFKTTDVGQRLLASALNTPVSVMSSAGEGGAWGIALLAAYMREESDMSLEDFLNQKVFSQADRMDMAPDARDVQGFMDFFSRYKAGLPVARAAVENLR